MTGQWVVLGAGSIGALWAIRLFQAGQHPTLLLRASRLAQYRTLTLEGEGEFQLAATSTELLDSPIHRLLVCCKTYQTLPALAGIAHWLADDATVVLAQNGLGITEQVQQHYPSLTVLSASTTNGAYRSESFTLTEAGRGDTLLGSLDGLQAAAAAAAQSLSVPGFTVKHEPDFMPILWRKLAINCAINPLTVRYRCRNGELENHPAARPEVEQICQEFITVSRALGRVHWVDNLLERVLDVIRRTAANRSSMLQDIEANRCTEIDAITGYLCREANALNIEIPVNQALYQEILGQQASAR